MPHPATGCLHQRCPSRPLGSAHPTGNWYHHGVRGLASCVLDPTRAKVCQPKVWLRNAHRSVAATAAMSALYTWQHARAPLQGTSYTQMHRMDDPPPNQSARTHAGGNAPDVRGVAARHGRLRHGIARSDLGPEQRLQPPPLVLLRTEAREHLARARCC